jgi:outer membrane protein assembly factor BamB
MKLRFVGAGLVFALCAALATWGAHRVAAQGVKTPVPGKDKEKEKTKSIYDENIPFEYPEERDAKNQLKAARDYLEFNDIPWKTVCPLLQNILDARSDSFFVFKEKVGDREEIRRISVKTEANRIIAAFPKTGLEFYQQLYGVEGERILKSAVENNYDLANLSDLSQRYFHTRAGGEATVLLGTIQLDRGNYLEAAHAFERLLTRPASEDLLTPRTLFKAALAFRRSGDGKHTELAKTTWEKAERPIARDGLIIGRRTFSLEQLKAELDRPVQVVQATSTVGEWPMRLGNAARNATVDGGPPFLDPTFRPTQMLPGEDEANAWIKTQLEKLFTRDSTTSTKTSLPLPGFFPLTAQDMVIFRSYSGVHAIATRDHTVRGTLFRAGDLRWRQTAEVGLHQLMSTQGVGDDIQARSDAMGWWGQYPQIGVSSILFENPLLGSLAHDGQNVYFVDDVAIPPPPVFSSPEFGMQGGSQYRQSGALANAIRAGRLVAVNMQTGKEAWELGRLPLPPRPDDKSTAPPPPPEPIPPPLSEDDADKTTSAFHLCLNAVFLGPPLPLHGKLYVVVEQAGVMRLLCLDPRVIVPGFPGRKETVPALVWSQRLGKPNNTLPQDSVRRYQGVFLASADGIMICPTNSGVVVAVDIMSRSLLWGRAYKKTSPAPARTTWDPMTGRPVPPVQLPVNRWRASAPVISGGRLVVTAYDSDKIECLDLRTGRLIWEVPRKDSDLYVGGVINDKVIVVGQDRVRAYHLHKNDPNAANAPLLAWESSEAIPTPTGHGAAGKAMYFIPVRQANAGKEAVPAAEIWAINVETGKVESKTLARKRGDNAELARYGLGNLVFQDGQVYAQSAWEVAVFPQLEEKRREMDRRLAANPRDPIGLTDRGELDLDDGKRLEAVGHFKEALKNNPSEGTRWRIREKLYVAYTEILKDNFAAGEPFLEEYKPLCELPLDTDDTDERTLRQDETLRRKRLYLFLLAEGRKGQGKLGEAFDHYMALATLGEGKTLLEMPNEANVRMRPDVWARGRIEGMIRGAADPAARKSLEDRVNKEWEAVKAGNDLTRLREFVGVFGPYFQAGSEAQFSLAERLLATNNEADAREAQIHLAQLRVTAEQRDVRAKAAEMLARLMIKHGQMEDAVGLYLQIGKEFPDVVIRDGKTGADLLMYLLTDRRLLPYLEPSRYPLPTRVKVEQKEGTGGFVGGGSMIEIDPEGDLLPMFRRLRFAIDTGASGNGHWAIRAFDRVTGAERARFTDLVPPNMPYGQPNVSLSRYVQASGRLLLVQLGAWVYCLDLSERRKLWEKNLLGDGVVGNPALQIEESTPDGDVTVKDADGYRMTLGKAAVLQPGYVCLLTRDGLEVVEPLTRRQLWVRRGIANRTQVYGDARYVVLVEYGTDRKPIATRLLRAVDGMPVEGAVDAGSALAAAKSFRLIGRTALLSDGGGDTPRVLRLYDLTTGKDVWRKEYDAKAVPVKPVNPDWTGFAQPNGEVELLAVATGETVAKFQIDTNKLDAHMKGCVQVQVLADPDRYYVVLDKDPNTTAVTGGRIISMYNYALRTHRVNGPMYAFDRGTGKRLWCQDEVFENQLVVLEQFADLPVILGIAAQNDRNGGNSYRVVAVEKERGLLRFNKPVTFNGYYFQSLQVDLKNGTVDLHRQDLRIHVAPDTEVKNE